MDYHQKLYERPLTLLLYHKASKMRVPLSGTFELLPVCNMACKMCYVRKTPDEVRQHSRPIMEMEEWLEIAERMRKEGTLYLLLTGGEPFLWKDFWILYERLHRMGFLISINTNGTLIDKAVIAKLAELPPLRMNITLYGANDETYYRLCGVYGMYKRVIDAVEGLCAAGIPVKLNGSITPKNAEDVDALIDFAQSHRLILQATTYMFPPVRRDETMVGHNERFTPQEAAHYRLQIYRRQFGEESYRQYLENVLAGISEPLGLDESCIDPLDGKVRCRAGKASFWITWDGYMSMCGMVPGYASDIREKGFEAAWQEVCSITNHMALSGTCAKCKNIEICHSCAAMAVAESGTPSGIPHYLCEMVQSMKRIAEEELTAGKR